MSTSAFGSSAPDPLRLGTRGSTLALWQANFVKSRLEAEGHRVAIETISTRGDEARDTAISDIGDEAVFTKELDHALLAGDIHLAVHSLKDIPSTVPEGISLAAVAGRENPLDAFVAHPSFEGTLADLPEGAILATASLRRTAQLRTWRPDLEVVPVRGNVDTRLEKLDASRWHGMVLAVAGLLRLGLSARIRERIDPSIMVPAVGQGALGVACAASNRALARRLRTVLHDGAAGDTTDAERAFLHEVQGGCQVPMGAWARLTEEDDLVIDACIAALDGSEHHRDRRTCAPDDGTTVARALAQDLLAAGGAEILDRILDDQADRASPFRP
ncbi:MAG: hydroxymethylbilane synthase [Salinibacter sp.]